MSSFADKLNDLCRAEAGDAIGNPDASVEMTAALVTEPANAIAVLTQGDKVASRGAAQNAGKLLAQMIFEKAALVRQCAEAMRAEAAGRSQQKARES